MRITIYQTISNVLNEDRSIRSSSTTEAYLIEPDPGKWLRNKLTGEVLKSGICVNKKTKLNEWEEIEPDLKANASAE